MQDWNLKKKKIYIRIWEIHKAYNITQENALSQNIIIMILN